MQGLSLRPLMTPLAISAMVLGVGAFHTTLQDSWRPDPINSAVLLVLLGLSAFTMPELHKYVRARNASGHQD